MTRKGGGNTGEGGQGHKRFDKRIDVEWTDEQRLDAVNPASQLSHGNARFFKDKKPNTAMFHTHGTLDKMHCF